MPDGLNERATTAIKALDENGRVGGYLVVFGSAGQKDLQGEYFTRESDLGLNWYEKRPALYHHGLDGSLQADTIGVIDTLKMDDAGVWAEAQLDLRKKYVQSVLKLVKEGALGWSSGSLPHLVKRGADGWIKRWPIVEGSLTPTPAEPRNTDIHTIKSAYDELGLDASKLDISAETNAIEPPAEEQPRGSASPDENTTRTKDMDIQAMLSAILAALMQTKPDVSFTPEEQAAIIASAQQQLAGTDTATMAAPDLAKAAAPVVGKAFLALVQQKIQASDAVKAAINSAVSGYIQSIPPPQTLPPFTGNGGNGQARNRITDVYDNRFDHLKPEDLIFGIEMLKTTGKAVSEAMLQAAAYKALREAEKGHKVYSDRAVKSHFPAVKADEIAATNLSGAGQDWVGAAYEGRIWESVREAPIYEELIKRGALQVEIPEGKNSVYIPTEGSDPTWYTLVEQNDLDADEHLPVTPKISTPTAPRRQLTVGGIAARVAFSDFMEEDALFPVLPFYRSRMEITAQEQSEFVFFNGDTATGASVNLNLIDGTPSVDSKGRGPAYLAADGILKLALITTSALKRDGGGFDETDFLETWKLLPATQQINQGALMWVLDPFTYMAALNIPAFKTRDVFNPATIESGQLKNVYGIDAFRSGQIGKANLAGKISATPGNNTLGRLSCVRPDQWALGWKRKVKTESARDIDSQSTVVVSTLRFGITYRNASGGVAVSFNLTI